MSPLWLQHSAASSPDILLVSCRIYTCTFPALIFITWLHKLNDWPSTFTLIQWDFWHRYIIHKQDGLSVKGRPLANRKQTCDLDLDWWPWYINWTEIFWKCTGKPKMNFPAQGFQQLELRQDSHTDRLWQTDRCDRMHYHAPFAGVKND